MSGRTGQTRRMAGPRRGAREREEVGPPSERDGRVAAAGVLGAAHTAPKEAGGARFCCRLRWDIASQRSPQIPRARAEDDTVVSSEQQLQPLRAGIGHDRRCLLVPEARRHLGVAGGPKRFCRAQRSSEARSGLGGRPAANRRLSRRPPFSRARHAASAHLAGRQSKFPGPESRTHILQFVCTPVQALSFQISSQCLFLDFVGITQRHRNVGRNARKTRSDHLTRKNKQNTMFIPIESSDCRTTTENTT